MRQLETNFLELQCCVLFYSISVDKIYFSVQSYLPLLLCRTCEDVYRNRKSLRGVVPSPFPTPSTPGIDELHNTYLV